MSPSWMERRGVTGLVELLSATCALGWAAYVQMAAEPLGMLPVYDVLSRYIPDRAWIAIAAACGAAQVVASMLNWRLFRFGAAFGALIWWKCLAVSLFNSGESAPASMVYCTIALFNIPTIVLLRPRGRRTLR